jgi:hypothetical protein
MTRWDDMTTFYKVFFLLGFIGTMFGSVPSVGLMLWVACAASRSGGHE